MGSGAVRPDGDFVLCWLHHAVRGHENPVLDTAVHLANEIEKPVLVYQGLGGKHRYNSDRHHTFIMEGARDLQAELRPRGIAYAFHLPRDPRPPGPLRALAKRSCLVVTEDFPAPPFPRWTRKLAEQSGRAVLAVDGACLMPIRSLGQRHTRAFKFRDAANRAWSSVIADEWSDVEPHIEPLELDLDDLGFESIDFTDANIAELAADCEIDHGVPPVGRVRGGSAAGYQRWHEFQEQHLGRYDRRRNDAADMEAVSGLSPYIHYGHVSPFRIAREANERGGNGAEKLLDELLVWRELAFNFCLHTPEKQLESLAALPDWASQTLKDHATDERAAVHSWETLARGTTGSHLWDLAQRSLIQNGELHNNLRMTWGKAIAAWSRSPDTSLRNLIDLNHRFALDGSDPNSYGGLLWCLGQFDRPFSPEQPVLGSVRGRSVEEHAERLSPERYTAAIESRRGLYPLRVAVVGGGISGLACARVLQEQGCGVVVFDRGRGPGGRMATRTPSDPDIPEFDHGAPYFTVCDAQFGRYVRSWIEDGVCDRWPAKQARWANGVLEAVKADTPLVVGTPSMKVICQHLARGLEVRVSTAITHIHRDESGWLLSCDGQTDEGPFDAVVLAMAPEQAARLVGSTKVSFGAELRAITSVPVWAGLFGISGIGDRLPDDLEVVGDEAIERIIRNERKPGRTATDVAALTVHARSDWSAERYDAQRQAIAQELADHTCRLLSDVMGQTIARERFSIVQAHRWGLARPANPSPRACFFDPAIGLVVCGDGLGGSGVEAAFLSGRAAAGRVLSLRAPRPDRRSCAETESLFRRDAP